MNKDRLKELGKLALKRLDLVTIGVLAVLLLLTGWLYQAERTFTVPPVDTPQRRTFTVRLPDPTRPDAEPENAEEYEFVQDIFFNPTSNIDEATDGGSRLVRNNMFELKTAEQQEEQREQLNAMLREAEAAYRNDQFDQALLLVNDILRQDRNHRGAADLRRQIQAQLDAQGS